jgi:hypothetical protein
MTPQFCEEISQPVANVSGGQRESHARFPRWEVQSSLRFSRGEIVFPAGEGTAATYVLCEGEILILRRGRPVDLIEPGEFYDPALWRDAVALAHGDCTLAPVRPSRVAILEQQTVDTTWIERAVYDHGILQPA